jgi:hypothetical protein
MAVNIATRNIRWERKLKSIYGIEEIVNLSDSLVAVVADDFYFINLLNGRGWEHDITTVVKYTNEADVGLTMLKLAGAITLATANTINNFAHSNSLYWHGTPLIGLGKDVHVARDIVSNVLQHDDKIYFSSYEKISCLTKDGQVYWEFPFSDKIKKMNSTSEIFIYNDRLFLVNKGMAEVNGRFRKFGSPFMASFSLTTGALQFFQPFPNDEPIITYQRRDSTMVVLTRNSVSEFSLPALMLQKNKINRDQDLGDFSSFANVNFLRRTSDSSFISLFQNPVWQYIYGENKAAVYDQNLNSVEKIPLNELYLHWATKGDFKFIGNLHRTLILSGNQRKMAEIDVGYNSRLIGDIVFDMRQGNLVLVNLRSLRNQKP